MNIEILRLKKEGSFAKAAELESEREIVKQARALAKELDIKLEGEKGALSITRERIALQRELAAREQNELLTIQRLRAEGNYKQAAALEQESAQRAQINDLIKTSNFSEAKARDIVAQSAASQAAIAKRSLETEMAISEARLSGREDVAASLEREQSRQEKIRDLVEQKKLSYESAVEIAERQLSIEDRLLENKREAYDAQIKMTESLAAGNKFEADTLKLRKEGKELAESLKISYDAALERLEKMNTAQDKLNKKNENYNRQEVTSGSSIKQIEKKQERIKKQLESDNVRIRMKGEEAARKFEDDYGIGVNDKATDYRGRKDGKPVNAKVGKHAQTAAPEKEAYDKAREAGAEAPAGAPQQGAQAQDPRKPAPPKPPSTSRNAQAPAPAAQQMPQVPPQQPQQQGGGKEDSQLKDIAKGVQALVAGQKEMGETLKEIKKSAAASAASNMNNSSK